jgi:hypothetical protein
MTRDDDFEAQVRLALGEHAVDAPRVDLADAALSQARGIRRRRTVLSAAAALAVVAVAVPVGAVLVNDSGSKDHTASDPTTTNGAIVLPEHVQVSIAALDSGDEPRVPYIDAGEFVDATGTRHAAEPETGKIVTDAAKLDDGTLLFQKEDVTPVVTYTTDGGPTDLPQAKSVTPPAIDHGTEAAVFAINNRDANGQPSRGDTLVYAKALNGGSTTVETGMDVRQVMGAYNGQVVFNAVDGKRQVVGAVMMAGGGSGVTTPWTNLRAVTAVSPDDTLLAGLRSSGYLPGQKNCAVMVEAADSTLPLWTNCDWNPVEFSPDGNRVLAIDSGTEGLGPNLMAVMDANTGSIVAEYSTDGVFGRATATPTRSSRSSPRARRRPLSAAPSTASATSPPRRPRCRRTSRTRCCGRTSSPRTDDAPAQATTVVTGRDESAGRSSADGVRPRRTNSEPNAATIAPLSVHRPGRGTRTRTPYFAARSSARARSREFAATPPPMTRSSTPLATHASTALRLNTSHTASWNDAATSRTGTGSPDSSRASTHRATAVFSPLNEKSKRYRSASFAALRPRGKSIVTDPCLASRSMCGPPGNGSPSRRATLSNASPAASSMVEPSCSTSPVTSATRRRLEWPPLTRSATAGSGKGPCSS